MTTRFVRIEGAGRTSRWRGLLVVAVLFGTGPFIFSCTASRRAVPAPVPGGGRCHLAAVGSPFEVFAPGRLFTAFARDRRTMLQYLFNADSLWPKTADLCARGRNALLDLELGPGASYEMGLWGPAWDAPIFSVAVTNPFRRGLVTGSRFLATWPLVADGQTEWLRQAQELSFLARRLQVRQRPAWTGQQPGPGGSCDSRGAPAGSRGNREGIKGDIDAAPGCARPGLSSQWARLKELARTTGLGRFRFFLCRMPPSLLEFSGLADLGRAFRLAGHCRGRRGLHAWDQVALRVAAQWGRRLTGALAHRLLRSPAARRAAGLTLAVDPGGEARFLVRLMGADTGSLLLGRDWTHRTESLARRDAVLFESRRYRRFRRDHLTVCLPGLGCGLGLTAVEAIRDRALARGNEHLARRANAAARRLSFVLFGQGGGLTEAEQKALSGEREAYAALRAQIEADRRRLGLLAKRWFAQTGARILSERLRRPGDMLLSSSFYFQTEHLEQTRSGFTHAALIEKLGRVEGLGSLSWQLDRVLGYFYIYPVSRLTHSVTVELLQPAPALVRRPRRYQWVRLPVPKRFRFSSGAVTDRVTIPNLLSLLVKRLRSCPRYYSLPGFFYAAASWMALQPDNARLLGPVWVEKTYRGGRYQTLSPQGLNGLKGKTLLVPVGLLPHGGSRDEPHLR